MSKTILITGASTGIGAETALGLAEGNNIILHYNRSEKAVEEIASLVEQRGGVPTIVKADLSNEEGTLDLVKAVKSSFAKLDVLFNNAGGLIERSSAGEMSWSLMQETFALNVFSAFLLSSELKSLLLKGTDPCIINNTSIAMRTGAPTASIYGASKGALDSFTRGMAKELAPDIRVNAVAPGVIVTPFHDKVTSDEQMARFKESNPLKKLGAPEHIVQAVFFLIENTFVNGETIDVNGGAFMR